MKTQQKKFKIAILEDSDFYNRLITKQIENFVKRLELDKNIEIKVKSYVKPEQFLWEINDDIDIAFLDYYLGNGFTASYVMRKLRQYCRNCRVVIISQARNMYTVTKSKAEGASAFIHKDKNLLARTCFIIEDEINARSGLRRYA
ncbi:MAG: response regulator [Flavobacteriales bacterium]